MVPTSTTTLGPGYGSNYAIRFAPTSWRALAGHTYNVTITKTGMTCRSPTPSSPPPVRRPAAAGRVDVADHKSPRTSGVGRRLD